MICFEVKCIYKISFYLGTQRQGSFHLQRYKKTIRTKAINYHFCLSLILLFSFEKGTEYVHTGTEREPSRYHPNCKTTINPVQSFYLSTNLPTKIENKVNSFSSSLQFLTACMQSLTLLLHPSIHPSTHPSRTILFLIVFILFYFGP